MKTQKALIYVSFISIFIIRVLLVLFPCLGPPEVLPGVLTPMSTVTFTDFIPELLILVFYAIMIVNGLVALFRIFDVNKRTEATKIFWLDLGWLLAAIALAYIAGALELSVNLCSPVY